MRSQNGQSTLVWKMSKFFHGIHHELSNITRRLPSYYFNICDLIVDHTLHIILAFHNHRIFFFYTSHCNHFTILNYCITYHNNWYLSDRSDITLQSTFLLHNNHCRLAFTNTSTTTLSYEHPKLEMFTIFSDWTACPLIPKMFEKL